MEYIHRFYYRNLRVDVVESLCYTSLNETQSGEYIMAYINAADVKIIRNELKVLFPANQGWKFSVVNRDHMAVSVTVLQAPINLLKGSDRTHSSVNHYWLADHYDGAVRAVYTLINDIVARKHWDKSDIQTDYFNCAYYYDINVGDYNTPFEYRTPKNIKSKTKWSLRAAQTRFKKQTVVNLLTA